MKCYFCPYDDPSITPPLSLYCPKCPLISNVTSSQTHGKSAAIYFKVNGKWMQWLVRFEDSARAIQPGAILSHMKSSSWVKIFSLQQIPNLTANNVVEKTKTYLIFL